MGGVGAGEAGLIGRGIGFQVAAHVPGRQPQRAQACDLELREVLADAPAVLEDLLQRRRDGRGFRIEFEIFVYATSGSFRGQAYVLALIQTAVVAVGYFGARAIAGREAVSKVN